MSDTNTTNGVLTLSEDSVLNTVILSENQAPTPQQDSASVYEFGTIDNIDVLSNDSDPEGDPLTVISALANNGSAYVNADNTTISYTASSAGIDTITYTVQDIFGNTAQSFVIVDVLGDTGGGGGGGGGFNNPPIASDDSTYISAGSSTSIDVLSNDYDPDGDYLTVIDAYSNYGYGAAYVNGDNTVGYTENYYGSGYYQDVITYTIQDSFGNTSQASVYIDIEGIYYPPYNNPPIANDDYVTTDEFSSVTVDVVANDYDIEGSSLTLQDAYLYQGEGDILIDGNNITVIPTAGVGAQEIVIGYTVTDGMDTSSATLNVSVSPTGGGNNPPVANIDSVITLINQPITVNVLANDTDADNDSLVLSQIYVAPEVGQVSVNEDNTVTFTPNAGFVGLAEIQYSIQDSSQASASSSLFVNVQAGMLIEGTESGDILTGTLGNDVIDGMSGDDHLLGDMDDGTGQYLTGGHDTLIGGKGLDTLIGASGNDTYVFNLGDGQDTINNYDPKQVVTGIQSYDRLVFGAGINPSDIQLTLGSVLDILDYAPSVTLSIVGTNDQVTIMGGGPQGQILSLTDAMLDEIVFADGTVWTKDYVLSLLPPSHQPIIGDDANNLLVGTDSDDEIKGLAGDDTLEGGLGNDYLQGGNGNDTYVFNLGDGHDFIFDTSTELNLIASFSGSLQSGDEITDANPFKNATLVDSYSLTGLTVGSVYQLQTTGDFDTILKVVDQFGNVIAANDDVEGSDDVLSLLNFQAQAGLNYTLYVGGYGNEQGNYTANVSELLSSSSSVLSFGVGINASDIHLTGNNLNDLILSINGTTDSVIVQNYFVDNNLTVTFADGTTWNAATIQAMIDSTIIIGTNNDDVLYGNDANNIINGLTGDDALYGAYGNDSLNGGEGWDYLDGGMGDDDLYGGTGVDAYRFGRGYGADYVFDDNNDGTETNIILLDFDIAVSDVRLTRFDDDLELLVVGTNDVLVLPDYFYTDIDNNTPYQAFEIQFAANGTIWNAATIQSLLNEATTITGTDNNDWLYGDDANNIIKGLAGDDVVYGAYGNDTLDGGEGWDYLQGDAGSDTYLFGRGYGHDVVFDYSSGTDINTIQLLADIAESDVRLTLRHNDLELSVVGTNDSLVLVNYFNTGHSPSQAFQLLFANGTTWNATTILNKALETAIVGTVGNDVLTGTTDHDVVVGLAGDDLLNGEAGDDVLYGNEGSDVLNGSAGGDYLEGGEGDDHLDGGEGHDTLGGGLGNDLLYGGDAGQELVIIGYQEVIVGYQDVIVGYHEVLVGYQDVFDGYQDVYVRDELVIIGYEDVIIDYDIEGQPIYETRPIEEWQAVYETQPIYRQEEIYESQPIYENQAIYETQPIYDLVAVEGHDILYGDEGNDTLMGGNGNDVLYGDEGNDILIGGTGNDYLEGGEGTDTYVYRVGEGYDIINNYDYSGMINSPNGELIFENLNHTDVSFMRDMLTTDLVMTINSTGETVRVQAYFQEGNAGIATSSYALASIHFLADGVILSVDDVVNRLVVNQAPVANNDVASTGVHITHYEDGSPDNIFADGVTVNVLANDHDPDSDALNVNILSVTGGTAYLNFDQTISYFADGSQNQAEIRYQISDGRGGYAEAVVTVDVAITESLVYTPIVPDEAPFDYNPTENDYGYAQGDPHMYTFDGVAYEFQAVGEFTFVQGDGYEVQIRTEAINNRVSGVTATAMKFGDDVVGIYSKAANRLVINGAAVELASGVSIKVGSGYVSRQGDTYEINDGAGHLVLVDSTAGYDFVRMPVPKNQSVTGLLGNANDSQDDEFMLRDGTQLDSNIPESTIYTTFANSWRVDNSTSLFVYGAGESTATYTNLNFPVDGVGNGDWRQDFDPNIVAWAEQVALDNGLARGTVVFENAVLDIVVSGNADIIQQSLQIAQELAEAGVELIVNQQMSPMQTGTLATLTNGLEDTTYILSVNDLLQGFTDVNGDMLSVVNLTANNGVLSDNQDGTYTFTPNANFYGTVNLNYQVSDGRGGMTSAENSFLLDAINDAPTVNPNVVFDTQQVNENQAFSFSVAQDAFIDVDGDNLSYSAMQANGDALPSWLSFDSATRTFMGTPSFNDAANLMLKVIASDGMLSTEQVFSLMVNNVNRLPTGSPTVVLANVEKGTQSYNVALSDLLQGFEDADGDLLTISNLTADHATVVNNNNGTYTLTLEANYDGVVLLNYQVTDGLGGSLSAVQHFNVVVNTTGTSSADTLIGGSSDDTYIFNHVRDVVVEADVNGGIDTVQADFSYNLGDNLENLILKGSSNLSGAGNNLDNMLTGNDGNNRLLAGLGNDTLYGGTGGDTLNGGEGADVMKGGLGNDTFTIENANDLVVEFANEGYDTVNSFITYTLTANVERLNLENAGGQIDGFGNELDNTLNGNNFANYLFGGAGNDTLQGKGGADTLEGGLGDDVYYVDNIGDVVTELAGEGTDKVNSTVSYTLTANVEQLYLTGIAGLSGTGNAQNNIIYGNSGNNLLSGGAGNDSLNGGAGNDTLDGGQGNDTLVGGLSNDTYLLGIGSGRDVIDNKDSVGNDVLLLGAGITAEQVWLRQLGNDLEVSIIGTNNSAKVKGWYSGDVASKIDSVQLADGRSLLANEVQTLVDAMATFAPPTTGQTTLSTEQQNALGAVITASW